MASIRWEHFPLSSPRPVRQKKKPQGCRRGRVPARDLSEEVLDTPGYQGRRVDVAIQRQSCVESQHDYYIILEVTCWSNLISISHAIDFTTRE